MGLGLSGGVSALRCRSGSLTHPLPGIGPYGRHFPLHRSQGWRREGGTLQPASVWGAQLPMTGLEAGVQGGA